MLIINTNEEQGSHLGNVVIVTPDIILSLAEKYEKLYFFKPSISNLTAKLYNQEFQINKLCKFETCEFWLHSYAFNGCDTLFSFFGIGKKIY